MAKIIDNYILIEGIGQGTFGEIHKGRNLISKEAVAVKTIKLDRFLNDTTLRDMIINEIQALKKLDDQYIVRMIKMLKSANNIYLVYEHLNGGSLANYLIEKGHLSEQEGRQIMTNVFKGFKTLNHEKIIHRNINPNNLFFNDGIIKIKNFFCCKSPASQKLFDPENFMYCAPEVLLKTQQPQYEDKCDIFSLGLVFYKMFFGQLPFPETLTQEQLIELYRNQEFNFNVDDLSESTANILSGMLQTDQSKRIEWQALFHEEQVPILSGLVNSTNANFASNYQINSQVQQFETIGQNFYISQQSIQNQVTTSPNEQLKRRTTGQDKENARQNKENENAQTFTKTIDKDQIQQQTSQIQQTNLTVAKQIQGQLFEARQKFNIIIQGICKIEQLENWAAKIKTEICMIFLIKKAIKCVNEMLDICQNNDRHWFISKNKNDIVKILQKDYEELLQQYRQIKSLNTCPHEELNTHEMIDEQYVDNVLIMIAKQIAMDLGQVRSSMRSNSQIKSSSFNYEQTSQRNGSFIESKQGTPNQYIFAIFLIDLVKGMNYEDQKPYFKKLEETKLPELLDFKLKAI